MDSSCENSTGDTADHPPRDAYHTVLTIAGSDPSGGAGIQADLKTIGALGCYGLSVIAVVTVQDTRGVRSMYPLAPSLIRDQLEVLWSDAPPDAVKTGLLPGPEQIEIVADTLRGHGPPPLVVDPVLGPSRGPLALSEDAVEAMKRHLFPLATLLTPNLPEASRLTGLKVIDRQGMAAAAKKLAESGCPYVLVKG
ncbi:MAG: bifunctional hydroxymethylpyrimidine kinase/phosphomethylpyrimidine kinase, partial [Deltaproteobacteria bacterium]